MQLGEWGKPDQILTSQVENQLTAAIAAYIADPKLLREHAGQEDSFRTGGYAKRQVLELVQNASDALLRSGARGRVAVVLTEDALYCANEGAPFDEAGIDAVTHAYISDKRGDEIGRFGLGFKSILAITNNAQVYSSSVSFEFNSRRAQKALLEVSEFGSRTPQLRIPTTIDALEEIPKDEILLDLSTWATTIIKMPLANGQVELSSQMQDFPTEFLLFANSVDALVLDDRSSPKQVYFREHKCLSGDNNEYVLERSPEKFEKWMVIEHLHKPSTKALGAVTETTGRKEIKIAYAAPLEVPMTNRLGDFWAYYPLQEHTSAWGIFNAPWAVNEDRTKMLENYYNQEILDVFVDIFLDAVPRFRTKNDPARHLDYLPSRSREIRGYGDMILTERIPTRATDAGLIPAADGVLMSASALRTLDFDESWQNDKVHQIWQDAPHTDPIVPHWTCFTTPARFLRLRELFVNRDMVNEGKGRDLYTKMQFTGLATWLTELGLSNDANYSTSALRIIASLNDKGALKRASDARIIPVGEDFARVRDSDTVFLPVENYPTIPGIRIVSPEFSSDKLNVNLLTKLGFREISPESAIEALLRQSPEDSNDTDWDKIWDMFMDIPERNSTKIIMDHLGRGGTLKFMTLDGTWRMAEQIINADRIGISNLDASRSLDTKYHVGTLAEAAGVITKAETRFPVIEEEIFSEYRSWAEAEFRRQFPSRPASESMNADFAEEYAPGPLSIFLEFDRDEDQKSLVAWTQNILKADSGVHEWVLRQRSDIEPAKVMAPHLWAIKRFGMLLSGWGIRSIVETLSPALVQYAAFLPVALEPGATKLHLVDELTDIKSEIWSEFLGRQHSVKVNDSRQQALLCSLVAQALKSMRTDGLKCEVVPAVVAGRLVSARPSDVYIAHEREEIEFLSSSDRPFLLCLNEADRSVIVDNSDCRLASEAISFDFHMLESGEPEVLGDLFLGLRDFADRNMLEAKIVRCVGLVKRVVTPEGTQDRTVQSVFDGGVVYVDESLDDHETLAAVSSAFSLGLAATDIARILRQRDDAAAMQLKVAARSCHSDVERLGVLVQPKKLRAKLPAGLLPALEALGADTSDAAIAGIFIDVHGADALRQLSDELSAIPLSVPSQWSGSRPATRFVKDLGFEATFAGERGVSVPSTETVVGRPGLEPLHDYQEAASEEIRALLRLGAGLGSKAMIELPTGAGKTRVAVESIVRAFLAGELSGPVLWIAQSEELCEQAVRSWNEIWREFSDERALLIGRLWSSNEVEEPDFDLCVIVATDAKLETSVIGNRDYEWLSRPTAVVVDEAHVAADSPRYTRILTWLGVDGRSNERPLLGLSATPFKGRSEQGTASLAARFGRNLISSLGEDPITELQNRGVLSKVERQVLDGARIELSSEERKDTDKFSRLSGAVLTRIATDEQRTKRIIDHVMSLPEDWPVLIFTSSVLSAQIVAAVLRSLGVEAAAVSGNTRKVERRRVISSFKAGEIRVLVNCDVLTQGFDAPAVRALYIARPTLSPGAYMQMVGRGLRGPRNGGSEECLIVDLQDSIGNLGRNLAFREFEEHWKLSSDEMAVNP